MTKKSSKSVKERSSGLSFIKRIWNSQSIWVHLLLIALFILVCLLLTLIWLNVYTNHGQQISMPDYYEKDLTSALKDASSRSFEIVVTDSSHLLEYPGGIIISQNPEANSLVKEGRKIYVTITKYNPDLIALSELPNLYGNIFSSMKPLIEGYQLKTRVLDYRYDSGPPNSILEVSYKGETIINREGKKTRFMLEKGGTLDFILAKSSGGTVQVPSLRCRSYAEAVFLSDSHKLNISIANQANLPGSDLENTFVTRQIPPFSNDGKMLMNDTIKVFLAIQKPSDCGNG